jgi:2'-5' RNA ligase
MKLNKIYTELITEGKEKHKYGCVMLYLELNNEKQKEIQGLVEEEDLYLGTKEDPGYGRETEPHVTVLCGIHSDVPDEDVEELIDALVAPELMLDKISIFDNADKGFDVVKFDVENKELVKMNDKFKKLPFTSNYPDYHAHVTLFYVKAGKGKKYTQTLDEPIVIKPNKIVYSKANGEKKSYKFK